MSFLYCKFVRSNSGSVYLGLILFPGMNTTADYPHQFWLVLRFICFGLLLKKSTGISQRMEFMEKEGTHALWLQWLYIPSSPEQKVSSDNPIGIFIFLESILQFGFETVYFKDSLDLLSNQRYMALINSMKTDAPSLFKFNICPRRCPIRGPEYGTKV